MIEIFSSDKIIKIKNSDASINLNTLEKNLNIDNFLIDFPWEYEKSWILVIVKEYEEKLFYSIIFEWKTIVVIYDDSFEMKEEIMTFFWDVDILMIVWNKNSTKVIESIEARIIIPFGEWKDLFLSTLWQHKEELETFKLKWELPFDTTEFINLK